jgi:hypothetical protein
MKPTYTTNSPISFPYPSITFNKGAEWEVLRITHDGRLIIGEGLSTDEATQVAAKLLISAFEKEIQEMVDARVAAMKERHPSWCCQKCGDGIGWIGRFVFPFFHKCKEASK